MAPSACDQKKAEIVRHAEMECSAEAKKAKAIYELKCLEVREKFKAEKEQAYRDLKQQERQELAEIKDLYEAGLEPIKAKHAEKLSAIREQYRIAAPEAGLNASAISETPSSPTLVTASVSPSLENCSENGCNKPNVQCLSSALLTSSRLRPATSTMPLATDPLTILRNLEMRQTAPFRLPLP